MRGACALVIGWFGVVSFAVQAQGLNPLQLQALQAYTEEVRQHYGVPGAAVAVVQQGEVVFAEGFGVRSLAADAPVGPETLFQIGSVTKSMTALMLATFIDEGKLSWDTPVHRLWPAFQLSDTQLTRRFRVRDLMSNSSGLPRNDVVWIGLNPGVEDLLKTLAAQPFIARPGQQYGYNNLLWATAGYLGPVAAGLPVSTASYSRLMHERVFAPIGMRGATTEAVPSSDDLASPHLINVLGELTVGRYVSSGAMLPAGFVSASAHDMAAYLRTQLSGGVAPNGRRVVSRANLGETWKPGIALPERSRDRQLGFPGATSVRYGMGWNTEVYKGLELKTHGGSTEGFTAEVALVPARNAGIVVLSNRLGAFNFTLSVRHRWLELLMGWPLAMDGVLKANEAALIAPFAALQGALAQPPDAEAFRALLGGYTHGFRLELRKGDLWLTRGAIQALLVALEPGVFLVGGSSFIGSTLVFAPNGSATFTAEGQPPLTLVPLEP